MTCNNTNTARNCIIWGNQNGQIYLYAGNGTNATTISYCAVEGGFEGNENIALSSENNGGLYSPWFVNPSPTAGVIETLGDYSWELQNGSICINRGNVTGISVPQYDLNGNPRIQQGIIDVGCYESPYQAIEFPVYNDGIVYVTQDGAGTRYGTSWDNACNNLQEALSYASSNNCNVWVAAGTYYGDSISEHNAFTMVEGVNVYGGFAGNEPADFDLSLRDFETNETILDGQNVQRVLYQGSAFNNTTIWDGFTINN